MRTEHRTYDNLSIALHWIIGVGILVLAGTELLRHEFPKGTLMREGLKPLHQPLGTVLFALIIFRIAYRLYLGRLALFGKRSVSEVVAVLVHLVLYALMVALPLLGLVYVFGKDRAIDFGLFSIAIPLKSHIGVIARDAKELHETLGTGILLLAGVHAAAALFHHYVLRDGVMRQMLPVSPPHKSVLQEQQAGTS